MRIYVDINNDFKCYTSNTGTMRKIDLEFFDGKCKAFIEGFRCIPSTDASNNEIYTVFAWREFSLLEEFQRQYEELIAQQEDMKAALELLGVSDEEADEEATA